MDANALPKGHIIGWAPPPQAAVPPASKAGMSKAQKKNEKRKEKRKEKREETKVKDNWDDDDDGEAEGASSPAVSTSAGKAKEGAHTPENPNWAAAPDAKQDSKKGTDAEDLADKLDKLEVR